jgi:hypothetical protein
MIIDLVMSLQNGYENRGLIVPYLNKHNYYDSCVKVGNEIVPQKILLNNIIKHLEIIPTIIIKQIPSLIGVNSIIEVDKLKLEIDLLKTYVDLDDLLYISSNCCVKYKDDKYFLFELDSSRILNIFGFMPNIIDYNTFLFKYSHPFFDCAGGFFNTDGKKFNNFKYTESTQSNIGLSKINPRLIGNIVGVINLFECFKDFKKQNNEVLYNYLNQSYHSLCQILYKDFLLSYSWLDLNKVNTVVKQNGVNIICCYGINLIKYLDNFVIVIDGEERYFNKDELSQNNIKTCIIEFFKLNSQITEILFF